MVYLDNAATTEVKEEVFEAMSPYLREEYGNTASKYYNKAVNAKNALIKAREQVASVINADADEIVFTSGASESNNLVIKGVADYKKYYEKKGNHIITTKTEHKSVLNTCKFLNGEIFSSAESPTSFGSKTEKVDRGYVVDFLDVDETGKIDIEMLKGLITNETVLVSVIWGNNEIATINDIKKVVEVCKEKGVLVHTDATQCIGKIEVDVKVLGVDFMSMSAHKIGGPKGTGALYIKSDEYGLLPFMSSLIHSGEQELGLRGGTIPLHNIVGFGAACEIINNTKENFEKYKTLDKEVVKLIDDIDCLELLGDKINRLPGIYSVVVKDTDFNNERFLSKVSEKYALSTGSACTLGKPSHVLEACGLSEYSQKVLRVSSNDFDNVIMFFEDLKTMV